MMEPTDNFLLKQSLARADGRRYYGDGGTIHGTTHLDVCTDEDGNVLQVWFRCQLLPFKVHRSTDRTRENPLDIKITGVEVADHA
jgi:hypothetical protein